MRHIYHNNSPHVSDNDGILRIGWFQILYSALCEIHFKMLINVNSVESINSYIIFLTKFFNFTNTKYDLLWLH